MEAQELAEKVTNIEDTEEQQIRAFLRERFLRFVAKVSNGEEAEMYTQENTTVTGNIRGFDKYFENIAVENLKTPYLPVGKAIVRISDLVALKLRTVTAEELTK